MQSILRTNFQIIIGRGTICFALAGVLLLGACGDKPSKEEAKKAAGVLSDYYFAKWRAPSPDWKVQKVKISKDYAVNVDAKIATQTLSKAIMERSKMEQMEIARLACPAPNDKIWGSMVKGQQVNIRLSGSAGHIINSLCDRPR